MIESESAVQKDEIEDDVQDEENLVEAQVSWDLGKALRLSSSNEKSIIDALTKIQECQDFVLPRKRGRPTKGRNRS